MGDTKASIHDFEACLSLQSEETPLVSSILTCLRNGNDLLTLQLFAIPPLVCFEPPLAKIQNMKPRLFMKRSRTVVGLDDEMQAEEDILSIYDLYHL